MCARCGTSKGGTEYCEECKKQMKELDKEAHCGSCPGDPGVKVIAEACPVCGNENESLGNLGQKDHYKCRNCGIMYSHDKQASCGHCGSLNAEITNRASKADVLKKIAEVQSPWIVVQKDGQDMIARREDVLSVSKESEEEKDLELQK